MTASPIQPALAGSAEGAGVEDGRQMGRTTATPRGGRRVTGVVGQDSELERLSVEGATGEFGSPLRAGCGRAGMSVAVARGIAERAHQGQIDRSGEPYIAHVGRVAAGVPLFARSVGWLHEVMERPGVDDEVLIGAGASPDESLALRMLSREQSARSDDAYLEHVRVIALSPGSSGRIARAVKRSDLLDHVEHRAARSEGWTPPYGAALVVLMMVSASSTGARSEMIAGASG